MKVNIFVIKVMKKVKGLKYKGTNVQMQRVKAKKAPKI